MVQQSKLEKMAKLDNIINGILTGYLKDGTPFSLLEFWKNIPFKYPDVPIANAEHMKDACVPIYNYNDFSNTVNDFTWANNTRANLIIMQYMNICKSHVYGHHSPDDMRDFKHVIEVVEQNKEKTLKDITFDDQVVDNVIAYINDNDIPLMLETFQYVKKKYIAGSLYKTNNKTLIKK